jgi:hypothetical protein
MALRWQKRLPENQNITINLGVLRALLVHQKVGLISCPFRETQNSQTNSKLLSQVLHVAHCGSSHK